MTDQALIRLSRVVAAVTVLCGVVTIIVSTTSDAVAPLSSGILQQLSGTLIVPAVVLITIPKVPRNGSVWAFAIVGLSLGFVALGDVVAEAVAGVTSEAVNNAQITVGVAPADLPLSAAIGVAVALSMWIPSFVFIPTLVLLLFPDGRYPEPGSRWRWVGRLAIGVAGAGMVALLWQYRPWGTTSYYELPRESSFANTVSGVGSLILIILAVIAIVGYVIKWKRARGDTRFQYRWVGFAFLAYAVYSLVTLVANPFVGGSEISDIVSWAMIFLIPVSYSVAILKYRLYGIDVIVSRSLTFGVLAVFIGVVYVGIVVGVGELFGGGEGSGFGLSVVATAVVAMGFQPVRVRVERWANRLVYGKRATPYEVLASFSHRATDESDEDVLARIPRLIVDGTGAVGAVVWVRSGGGFRAASTWPEADSTRRLPGGDGGFMDPDADVSLPVFHDGELLGGISMVAARGGAITPPELELVENLADGLGLTLRNAQLTAALRRQVKDLQRSRDRIVSAADAARRSLEHDLDSGPQQQLVAVKVKLGPVRKLAEDAGATRTAGLLADIESQAGDAIQAVRDFAAGVYPPLLGAEGLAVALTHETRKAAVPVHLEAHDVGRYPRDIESAVYFSILEALQNTAKYAEASQATVRLTARNGDLRFEVSDDGRGFDPTTIQPGAGLSGIADRIDTIGGTTTITSTPGTGTTITGSIPVKSEAFATANPT